MFRKRLALVGLASLALGIVPFVAQAQDATAAATAGEPLIESICLVTDVGHVNDGGFNQFAYEGLEKAGKDFDLKTTFIETQAQTDYANNIQTCLSQGYNAVMTVGFLITDATLAAAKANPSVYFIGVDQGYSESLPNLVGIQYREDQGGFLVGAMAALMSKSGHIAGVYGIDVPAVVRFRHGYEQGAKYINPDIKVDGLYIDSFTAADRGAAAAQQFMGEGADVIFGAGGQTGNGAALYAAQNGALAIGVDQDQYATIFGNGETPGSDMIITSAVKRVDVGAYNMIQALVDGTGFPEGSLYVLDVNNGGITFAEKHDADVPDDVTAKVTAVEDGLKDGSIETGVDPANGALLSEEAAATAEATAEATP